MFEGSDSTSKGSEFQRHTNKNDTDFYFSSEGARDTKNNTLPLSHHKHFCLEVAANNRPHVMCGDLGIMDLSLQSFGK